MYLHLPIAHTLTLGALGQYAFAAGSYSYIGSALGTGGLRARLTRHTHADKRLHWHIDFLLRVATVRAACYVESVRRYECRWSQGLLRLPQAYVPAPRFGASDCRDGCAAHLIGFEGVMPVMTWHKTLGQLIEEIVTLIRL